MSKLEITSTILAFYLLVTFLITYWGSKRNENTPEDYFLAGRKIGAVVLFFTLISTNLSAFFFLGFAGAGYRLGYSYYGIMTMGTSLIALAFYFIGQKTWALGKKKGYITPPEMISQELNYPPLRVAMVLVMVFFTVPYIAIQPIGAGHILSQVTDGQIPYFVGASSLTLVIVGYVFVGGMRTAAWTDVFQGILMFFCIAIALFAIAENFGGISEANQRVFEIRPDLFSMEGTKGYFTSRKWFSFMLLWLFCVPMFPQMFMRFFTAESPRSLKTAAVLYPLVTAVLFIFPIAIGIMGHLAFPGLEGKETDKILPLMLNQYLPIWLATTIMVGAVAAFMSTLDSQLLALSSILTRDFYLPFIEPKASLKKQILVGKGFVVVVAIFGLALAYQPPATIFKIATEAFTGLAVLFPTVVAALHLKRVNPQSCLISIVVGEFLVVAFAAEKISISWAFGFLPVIPIVGISTMIILLGSYFFPSYPIKKSN